MSTLHSFDGAGDRTVRQPFTEVVPWLTVKQERSRKIMTAEIPMKFGDKRKKQEEPLRIENLPIDTGSWD